MIIKDKRKGRIEIVLSGINCTLEILKELFKEVVPLQIEQDIMRDKLIYYCISEHFREISDNEVIPLYSVLFTINNETRKISLTFEEVKNG